MQKRLIIRLSSLGDVILATHALDTDGVERADWVVAKGFEGVLQNHPKIGRVWVFDRSEGLAGWLSLCQQLHSESYSEVIDLHSSLRTCIARVFFRFKGSQTRWRRLKKDRFRNWGYFLFKGLWPSALRPHPKSKLFGEFIGMPQTKGPSLAHLAESSTVQDLPSSPFICVMPASRWKGKEWPVDYFVELLRELGHLAVVLGTRGDRASLELQNKLNQENIPVIDGVGKWTLSEVATVLSHSKGYLGCDTGLAHLAEAMGVPAYVFFGPTAPDGGFGPWRDESVAMGASLWCRPCGKDGRYCFRLVDRYACQTRFKPAQAREQLKEQLKAGIG